MCVLVLVITLKNLNFSFRVALMFVEKRKRAKRMDRHSSAR
jgi:hypothetical protein